MVVNKIQTIRTWVPILVMPVLAACSGGGDDDDVNRAPSANAGADSSVAELSQVTLDGSASTDPDTGDNLNYAWTQTSGQSISINGANLAQATFTAPDVVLGSPEELIFQLTVTDGGGLSSSDSITITVVEPGPPVTISGTAEYEFVPTNNNCQGLAFPSTQPRPIRGATVQALRASDNALLAQTTTDDSGAYSLTVESLVNVYLRVRAELKRGGSPAWDVEVRDNTSDVGLALYLRPIYVLDTSVFSSGVGDQVVPILAETGWDSSSLSYTGVRAAAPFSILDVIYDSMQLVLTANSTAQFPSLDAYWSVNNTTTQGGNPADNIDSGEIGGSFYTRIQDVDDANITYPSLFLVGMEDDDTEEFDDHVIAHEWGHYFEDNFSRSDSIGGPHALGERLDPRLAFGEGWGTAFSGMSTGSPIYCDTGGSNQAFGFGVNIESPNILQTGIPGWYNETTVLALLYDLWDTNAELGGVDNDSIGFAPIYDAMTNEQRTTGAFTSVFSFMTELKNNNPGDTAFIDALLMDSGITTNLDIFGSNETNDSDPAFFINDVIPVYTQLTIGNTVNVCSNSQFDNERDGNNLSERQLLRFNVPVAGPYNFEIITSNPPEIPPVGFNCTAVSQNDPDDPNAHRYSDPDFFVYQNGTIVAGGTGCTPNQEITPLPFNLSAGEHVMSVLEFRFADDDTVAGFTDERICFDITVTAQ